MVRRLARRAPRRWSRRVGFLACCAALLLAVAGMQADAATGPAAASAAPTRTVTKTVTKTATRTATATRTVTAAPRTTAPRTTATVTWTATASPSGDAASASSTPSGTTPGSSSAPSSSSPAGTGSAPAGPTAPSSTEAPTSAPTGPPAGSVGYPWHTNIVATTFWVGEIFDATAADGSQVCSTYDGQWAYHWSGINLATVPSSSAGCAGSILGGCDGAASGSGSTFRCATEARAAANGFFPTTATPRENPFYLDLPFDDLNDGTGFATRCQVIPWAAGSPDCSNPTVSFMKNAWVQIVGPNGAACYGQIQDAGPSSGSNYHDSAYVFGSDDRRPLNRKYSSDPTQGAGMDVSPALNGCLGFADLDGDSDHVSWRFVAAADVPSGPWRTLVTTSGVTF